MTHNPSSSSDLTVTAPIAGDSQVVIDVLQSQYGQLDAGEARTALETYYVGGVWNDAEFAEHFEASHFTPPYVHAIRKADGARGTLMFVDAPRFYFSFNAESNTDGSQSARV